MTILERTEERKNIHTKITYTHTHIHSRRQCVVLKRIFELNESLESAGIEFRRLFIALNLSNHLFCFFLQGKRNFRTQLYSNNQQNH